MEIKKDILWRVYLSYLAILIFAIVVLSRVVYIQRVQGEYWVKRSDSLHQKIISIDAERGTIYSDDGQMLSTSLPQYDVYMDFCAEGLREDKGKIFFENVDSFAYKLSTIFPDKSYQEFRQDLKNGYTQKQRYFLLKRSIDYRQYKQMLTFPLVKLGKNTSGVIFKKEIKRLLPYGLLANRTIGLSREYLASNGAIKKSNVGLEKSYDDVLQGQKGAQLVRYIAGGISIPVKGYELDPENGKDIYTNIDVNIQDITQAALLEGVKKINATYGTAIVMETATGKVRAIANLGRHGDEYYEDDNYALKVNEPGSTIKLVTLLSTLMKETTSLNTKIEVGLEGRMQVGPRMVNDAERFNKSILTVQECFEHSSNVGMSKIALNTFGKNPSEFKTFLHKFKLDEKVPIDLKDIPNPVIAPLAINKGGVMNMITMSFGYALQISPMHIAMFYNAVANNGKMMKPYLVNSIEKNGEVIEQFEPQILVQQIAPSSVIQQAQQCMVGVVQEGTAKNVFKNFPFQVAGKTGTAKVSEGALSYDDNVYQASFVGYFPAQNPQYTCIVSIRTSPGSPLHYGGDVAAPVFKDIALKLYAKFIKNKVSTFASIKMDSAVMANAIYKTNLDVIFNEINFKHPPVNDDDLTGLVIKANNVEISQTKIIPGIVPDVKNMKLKDALYLLESLGLSVKVVGQGKVVQQSILPGTKINAGDKIEIQLEIK